MKTVAIITAIEEAWGGCEELWAKSVPLLMNKGCRVMVFKSRVHTEHPEISALIHEGVLFHEIGPGQSPFVRLIKKAIKEWNRYRKNGIPAFARTDEVYGFTRYLSAIRPDLVLVSQGINFDGMGYAYACKEAGIPYVIVSHKAVDFYWPNADDRKIIRSLLQHAMACYFVSKHNLRLTEEQFGVRLSHAQVVFNPVKLTRYVEYPAIENGFRVCCVARLFVGDKGQDILLRILSQKVWKERPLYVTFIGEGQDKDALVDLAYLLGVTNVSFVGFNGDIEQVWRHHHALILPSRCEGLPLTIVEAMNAGRPVITTYAGGNAELLKEGVTSFIGHSNEESFGDAMERAWVKRMDWEEMGKHASTMINQLIPKSPEKDFAEMLMNHL